MGCMRLVFLFNTYSFRLRNEARKKKSIILLKYKGRLTIRLDESGRIQYMVSRNMCRMSAEGGWSAKSVRLVQLQLGTIK